MTYDEIIDKVSKELGLSKSLTNKIYRAYWKTVKDYIESLPLKENLKDEEFQKLRPNVNIPSLGKLYVTLDMYKWAKKKYEILTKIGENKDVAHNED